MSKQEFKVGDLVRVSAKARRTNGVGFKQGQVVEVTAIVDWGTGVPNVEMRGGWLRNPNLIQTCRATDGLSLAKQAMKKRAEYEARRG